MGFIWAEVYFFNMFLEKATVLDNHQITKFLMLGLNASLAGVVFFVISSADMSGLKTPMKVIKSKLDNIT